MGSITTEYGVIRLWIFLIEELKLAVQKVVRKNTLIKQILQLDNLIQLLQRKHHNEFHRIALQSSKETRFGETDNLKYLFQGKKKEYVKGLFV